MKCVFLFFPVWVLASLGQELPPDCARYFDAVEKGSLKPITLYNAACCYSLSKNADRAFAMLDLAIAQGFSKHQWLEQDKELAFVQQDPRWPKVILAAKAAEQAFLETVNRELYEIYRADQDDRKPPIDWEKVTPRDLARQERVQQIMAAGGLKVAGDFYHAALVFQHGQKPEDFKLSHGLCLKTIALEPDHDGAKWLTCAAEDRWLQNTGKPQVWGTQYTREKGGSWTNEPFDRTAKTDEERVAMGVKTLAEIDADMKKYNRKKQ